LKRERRTRALTVLAQDPSVTKNGGALTVKLTVPTERLAPGPWGARVHVIDYDGTTNTLYEPFRLDGDDPFSDERDTEKLVGDPRFHAQNVYTIAMSVLCRFEQALGRRAPFAFPGGGLHPGAAPGRGHVIKIAPHAFSEANAFYSRRDEGLFFGYFPGKRGKIFSCLSHDVVAHESTHALLDGLRSRYTDPSSPDQAAFHEGFADCVALLSVFRNEEVIDAALGGTRQKLLPSELSSDALKNSVLLGLADQMGREMRAARGDALRRSATLPPSRKLLSTPKYEEPHARGEVFVAAMMNAFLDVWLRRLGPLGLADRRAIDRARAIEEGSAAASHLLTMAIRAIDYAPPVDLQFSDYLTSLLTADHEAYPDDRKYGYRDALRKWFGSYGIDPLATRKGPERGMWEFPEKEVSFQRSHFESLRHNPDEVFGFVWENRVPLELHPEAYTYVPSVRQCTRIEADGFTLRETVAEYVQVLDLFAHELDEHGLKKPARMSGTQPVRLYGGGVLIFDEFGRLKFHIGSGVASPKQQARLEYLWANGFFSERQQSLRRFAHIHRERAMRRQIRAGERW
jgi:hypothetical protein